MKVAIFIVGLLSALSALFFGWVFCLSLDQSLPTFVRLILIVPSLWLLPSSFYLLLKEQLLPLSRKTRIVLGLNILLVTSMIVVVTPNFVKSRATSCTNPCINNLRQIDAAANQFALEKGLTNGQSINFPSDLTLYIKLNSAGKIPPCPAGGTYHISKVGETPTCTLSTATPAHALQ